MLPTMSSAAPGPFYANLLLKLYLVNYSLAVARDNGYPFSLAAYPNRVLHIICCFRDVI